MSKAYSKSVRAQYQRNARQEKSKRRHFNNPLRVFIEYKYPNIFSEYTKLYNELRCEYPNKKSLEKTMLFRQHLELKSPPENDILKQDDIQNDVIQDDIQDDIQNDILKQAFKETIGQQDLPQELPQGQPLPEQGPSQLYPSIDEILDELAADEDIGPVLDQGLTGEDEGIGLNLEDEIFHDIQPFDFELEIE